MLELMQARRIVDLASYLGSSPFYFAGEEPGYKAIADPPKVLKWGWSCLVNMTVGYSEDILSKW